MRLPRAMFRSLLSPAVFAILVLSTFGVRADDATSSKSTLPKARKEHLLLAPANLRFGKVAIGQRNIRTVTITNWGDSSVTLNQAVTRGTGFTLSGLDLPLTLARGESFTFSSVFMPRSRGNASGSVSFVSDVSSIANPSLMLELAGTGTDPGQLTVDPATMDFGSVPVGSLASQPGKLSAPGAAVTVYSASISDSEFTLGGLSFPFTIPAGGSQGYTVLFAPQASGTVSATLSFLTADGSSLTVQSLTGIGTVAQTHSVDLSWNASTSQDVIGYNVYRGNASGGPYSKINTVLDASTVYTDTSVINGSTYYYVTTAVDSSNQESVYSNEAQAVIPGQNHRIAGSTRGPAFSGRIAMRGSPSRNH